MISKVLIALNVLNPVLDMINSNGSIQVDAQKYCPDMGVGYSCMDVSMILLNTTLLTAFEIETEAILKAPIFAAAASGTGNPPPFVVQTGYGFPTIVVKDLTGSDPSEGFSSWSQRRFPQDNWVPLPAPCVSGNACSDIPTAPSTRYEHASIMYQTWNVSDILEHQSFCKIGTDNSMCTETCAVDVSCLRPSHLPPTTVWNLMTFYAQTIDATFWLSSFDFLNDDSSIEVTEPTTTLSSTCPGTCCGNRRKCMRTHDNLGKVVPFNRSFLLVFGGRTRQRQIVPDPASNSSTPTMDLFLNCEYIMETLPNTDPTYAQLSACSEIQSDELWRYDTVANTWELIKPNTDEVLPTSGGSTADLYPYGRYGHAATFVDIPASRDSQGYRRKYMFIFGGVSNKCVNGLCSDIWRYDIPWAAESFWPINGASSLSTYNRGNRWKKLTPCPFGGRFRHTMVASENGDVIYSYGGQKDLSWDQHLLVYQLSTDTWEMVNPAGYRYFTRTYIDYKGTKIESNYTDFSSFDPNTDLIGELGFLSLNDNYPDYPPKFPTPRGDLCMVGYTGTVRVNATLNRTSPRVIILTGFRTYDSPYPNLDPSDNPFPTLPYYLDDSDVWQYDELSGTWTQLFVGKPKRGGGINKGANLAPLPRRGSSAVTMNDGTTDGEYIALFGGYRGDQLYGDMWLLRNYKDENFENREWIRIDDKLPGTKRPDNVTYHTLNFDPISGKIFIFGGLNWTSTNLTLSDSLVDVDRRCYLAARGIIKTVCTEAPNNAACALQLAKQTITQLCNATSSEGATTDAFCCNSVAVFPFINQLTDLAQVCTTECQDNSFQYEMSLGFGEGVWVLDPNACENSCTNKGVCKWGRCLCQPGFTGSDCSVQTCPGSFCYYNPNNFETVCNECSGNGKCGQSGICECNDGWTGPDCGAIFCTNNCTNSQFCLPDFPINQCICDARKSGRSCEIQLCLNNCSKAGNCTSDGSCLCEKNFFGLDCSVYIPTLSGGRVGVVWAIVLVLFVTMVSTITDQHV